MVEEKNPTIEGNEESNIDHINNHIDAVSEDAEVEPVAVEDIEAEEQHEEKTETPVKKEAKVAPTKKIEQKKTVKAKPEPKKETKKVVKKIIKKPVPVQKTQPKMTKQKTVSKESKKTSSKKEHTISKKWVWIVLGVLALIIIAGFVVYTSTKSKAVDSSNATIEKIAATVNGEPIYQQDIDNQYNAINPALQAAYTKESLLNKSIEEVLLAQAADKYGIVINGVQVSQEIENIKKQNSMSDTELGAALAKQGISSDEFKKLIQRTLKIRAYLNATILQNVSVTENEMRTYYQDNIDSFTTPDQVKVQHILILTTDNTTVEQANAKIADIQKQLTPTNFCTLVTNYSEDSGSVATCGTYTFAKGEMVPEFEAASFDMAINEVRSVQTVYGIHLIKKLENIPSELQSFDSVKTIIEKQLGDQKIQEKFNALLDDIHNQATIVNYMTTSASEIETATDLDSFAQCLTDKGAVFYGAYWCPHCNNQKELFGSSMKFVKYVECATQGTNDQTAACNAAGITGYPTWIINGEQYSGEQSFAKLASLTGCRAP